MPAPQEAPRPQPTGNMFERGIKAIARSPFVRTAAVGTIAFGADACAPQAQPTDVRSGGIVAAEPGAMATIQAGEARAAATAFADRVATQTAQAKPTETATPAVTAEARLTATPIGIGGPELPKFGLPEIDAIGEKLVNEATRGQVSEKDVVRWNAVVRLSALSKDVNSLPDSLDSRISKEEFESKKGSIVIEIGEAKKLLESGDIVAARKKMYTTEQSGVTVEYSGILTNMLSLGDPLQSRFVSQEVKQKHDPKDKYIGKHRVDSRIYNVWLSLVDVLVGTDPSY